MVSNSVPCIRELKILSAEAESSSLVEMGHDNIWYSRPRKFGAGSRKCKACSRPWSDQEVPPEHLQAVLPRVRQGHWIPEAGLELVAPLFRKQCVSSLVLKLER